MATILLVKVPGPGQGKPTAAGCRAVPYTLADLQ